MPKPSGRGKTLKTRNVSLPGGQSYLKCDVMSKAGPRGGRTSCTKHSKKSKR